MEKVYPNGSDQIERLMGEIYKKNKAQMDEMDHKRQKTILNLILVRYAFERKLYKI